MLSRLKKLIFPIFLGLLTIYFFYLLTIIFKIYQLRDINPMYTSLMEYQIGEQAKDIQLTWTPYKFISNDLKRAVIAAEDDKFIQHQGYDWASIENAIYKNLKQKKKVGGSTISQQLAKNLFLNSEKKISRKLNEFVITFFIEMILSKKRILEIYLNVIEWGNKTYGVHAASKKYFSIKPLDLNALQSAKLASMINNPKYFDKNFDEPYLVEKTFVILNRMQYSVAP
jgi:monofunctional biosynthetic peptidoglycan transglycosylase